MRLTQRASADVNRADLSNWFDLFDRTAERARFDKDLYKAENIHILQREAHPSLEYPDDILPLFSDRWAAIYRLSCIVAGLRLLGGVHLNPGKLAMLHLQWLQTVWVTAAEVEAYVRSCGTWLSCKFCGLHRPDMVALPLEDLDKQPKAQRCLITRSRAPSGAARGFLQDARPMQTRICELSNRANRMVGYGGFGISDKTTVRKSRSM
eukprot:COSAG02_NODE_3113_length_7338_cov_2.845559_5_plen_208_part_00